MRRWIGSGALFLVALVLGCSSSGSREDPAPGPITPARTIPVPWNAHALAGYGDTMALEFTDVSNSGSFSGFRSTLQLYRRDPAFPLELLDLGTVYLGVDTLYHRLTEITVTADRAAVTLNYNDGASGWIAVIAVDGTFPAYVGTIPLVPTLDHAVASGRWLLVAAGHGLALVDLEDVDFSIVKTFDMGTTAACLMPVSDGFLVFTNNGYGHVTAHPTDATYVAVTDASLLKFRKAYVVGDRAHVAGPSPFAGKTRVAKLDISAPGAPAVVSAVDVEGPFGQFAYDGTDTYVLSFPDWQSPAARTVVIRDVADVLRVAREFEVTGMRSDDNSLVHVRAGTLYALAAGGVAIYPLP